MTSPEGSEDSGLSAGTVSESLSEATTSPDGPRSDAAASTAGPAPEQATLLFGNETERAQRFADLLASSGVTRGLIGPREVPILWGRHLINCALLADLLPQDARVVDVGSGAGLPGLVLALRRPDLRVDLVEPMLRRTTFLLEAVELLSLQDRVRVVRGRAEEKAVRMTVGEAEWVTARAVAPLDRLVRWCLPLLAESGTLLALKGERGAQEAAASKGALHSGGASLAGVEQLGEDDDATWVVRVHRAPGRGRKSKAKRTARGAR